jgi:hypothetical protein
MELRAARCALCAARALLRWCVGVQSVHVCAARLLATKEGPEPQM